LGGPAFFESVYYDGLCPHLSAGATGSRLSIVFIMSVVNIAAYRFVGLDGLPELRTHILEQAAARQLKGTVLLASEGINLFLAGAQADIDGFLAELCTDPRFAGLEVKRSVSETQPFRNLLVKIKREIIRMDFPAIRPEAGRAPAVEAKTLQRWLRDGRDDQNNEIVLVDTRNAFEVDFGTFDGALDFRISRFTEFPRVIAENREALKNKTVITFCTGGIRCEKAALYMAQVGMEKV